MKVTSQSLGLPTQKFSRDHVSNLDEMADASIEYLLGKQKRLLLMKDLLPDKGVKLEKAIKDGQDILIKRKDSQYSFAEEFGKMNINESKFPVCGKRQFSLHETKQSAKISVLKILSFEESQEALKACQIKVGGANLVVLDKNKYREPVHHNEFDSDDSKSETECLDSDDDD